MVADLKTTNEQKRGHLVTAVIAGGITGALVGLVTGAVLYAVTGEIAPLALSCLVGALLGGVTGYVFMSSAVEETVAPGISGRDYVGVHAPDSTDTAAEPATRRRAARRARDAMDQPPES